MTLSYSSSISNANGCMANDEWPDIVTFTTPLASNTNSMPSGASSSRPKTEQVTLQKLSENDLTTLKQSDPFMYYSIPSIRKATLLLKDDVNLETIRNDLPSDSMRRNCVSCPGQIQTNVASSTETTVSRSGRLSFECHTDMILADVIEESMEEMDTEASEEAEDFFMDLMARYSRK